MRQVVGLVLAIGLMVVPAMAQEMSPAVPGSSANMNMDILMQKVKADKKLLVAANMDLNDAEGKKFWPIYDAYQQELAKINETIGKTVTAYAEAFNAGKGAISNETAEKLLKEALSIEETEVKTKRAYAEKVGKVLSPTKTVRYVQIENKIRAVIKAQLAQEIPLVY